MLSKVSVQVIPDGTPVKEILMLKMNEYPGSETFIQKDQPTSNLSKAPKKRKATERTVNPSKGKKIDQEETNKLSSGSWNMKQCSSPTESEMHDTDSVSMNYMKHFNVSLIA